MTPDAALARVNDDVRGAESILSSAPVAVSGEASWSELLARAQAAAARARAAAKAKAKELVAAARNAAARLARGARLAAEHDPVRKAAWKAVEITTTSIGLAVLTPWILLALLLSTDTGRRAAGRGARYAAIRMGI